MWKTLGGALLNATALEALVLDVIHVATECFGGNRGDSHTFVKARDGSRSPCARQTSPRTCCAAFIANTGVCAQHSRHSQWRLDSTLKFIPQRTQEYSSQTGPRELLVTWRTRPWHKNGSPVERVAIAELCEDLRAEWHVCNGGASSLFCGNL